MRSKKLLTGAVCMVLAMSTIAGCAKEESTVNQSIARTTPSETPEVSKEVSAEVSGETSEQASTEAEKETLEMKEAIDPDDIKLRNPFIEGYADNVILPAEPDMEFNEDVELALDQLTWVEMGRVGKYLGELTTEDMLSVGYIDAYGEEAAIDERLEMIAAGAKGYSFDAYYEENVIDRILVMESISEEYSSENMPEIAMKFTDYRIQVGDDAETLKQLGVPALTAQIDEDMTYYWQVETEEGGCCLCVKVTDQVIHSMEIMIF